MKASYVMPAEMDPAPSMSRWTSSRVALQSQKQDQASSLTHDPQTPQGPQVTRGPQLTQGSQASRWAKPATSTSASATTPSSRYTPPSASGPTRGSGSSSGWRSSSASPSSEGASGSRWASSSNSQSRPFPSNTSTHSSSHNSAASPKINGLKPRDASRPLGGKQLDRMALLASPSRGLDSVQSLSTALSSQGSMDLTSPEVQEEFREYISSQIQTRVLPLLNSTTQSQSLPFAVLDSASYLPSSHGKGKEVGNAKASDELGQILLQVRKLREAVVAAKRADRFAVDVYLLSVYLSILLMDIPQLASSLPRLVLDLYPSLQTTTEEGSLPRPLTQTQKDVDVILQCMEVPRGEEAEAEKEEKEKMLQLYMLQMLCLAGKAKRLGQYAAGGSTTSNANDASMAGVLKEYVAQRATLVQLYCASEEQEKLDLDRAFAISDKVYAAVRDTNPFLLGDVLAHQTKQGTLDIWQRTLLYQLVPTLRNRAWRVAQKAYLYLPISLSLAEKLNPGSASGSDEPTSTGTNCEYLSQLLLLTCEVLPPSEEELAEAQAEIGSKSVPKSTKDKVEPPDEWDAETDADLALILDHTTLTEHRHQQHDSEQDTLQTKIEDRRIMDFLLHQFSPILNDQASSRAGDGGVKDRIIKIKEGYAVKIR